MKKTVLIVFVLVIALAGLLIFSLYEYKEVPDVSWRETYLPTDKEPYGTWMFRQLLEEQYGIPNVLDRYKDIELTDIDEDEECLLIMIGDNINLNFEETDAIANFSNEYNDILIIGNRVDFDYDWGLVDWKTRIQMDSQLLVTYPLLSKDTFDFKFYTNSLTEASNIYHRYFRNTDTPITEINDTVTSNTTSEEVFDYTDPPAEEVIADYETAEEDDYEDYEPEDEGYIVGTAQGQSAIYKEWDFVGDRVGIHLVPQMFTNQAAHQDYFLDHFNLLIGEGDYDKIIFEHPSFNSSKRSNTESPIQFILDNRSLKWSYITLLIGALLYVIFRGKRKQRIVPTIAPNTNTSIEYVETLGSLYEHQNKPRKLVKHMQDIFHHDVKARYFLDHHDEDYVQKLSKKSNIAAQEIEIIVKTFTTIKDRFEFTESDLSLLYRKLDAFYKNCK